MKKNYVTIFVLIAVVVIAIIVFNSKDSVEKIPVEDQVEEVTEDLLVGLVEEYEIQEIKHIAPGEEHEAYNSNPPSSGWHYAQAPAWGIYNEEMVDESAVHGLEHGGIWISYKNISDEEIKELEKFQKTNSQSTILSPREANDSNIVLVSWGYVVNLDSIDTALMQQFVDNYKNQTHEPFAK
jgi:hypothetical protein